MSLASLFILLSGVLSLPETPKPNPAPAADCDLSWSGHYRNLWGYEVTIPDGRKGFPDSPVAGCGEDMSVIGDHGIVIPLSSEPYESDRELGISSGYNSGDVRSVAEAAAQDIHWIRKRRAVNGTPRVLRRTRVSLAGLPGIRVVIHYRDKRSGRDMVNDILEILRPAAKRDLLPAYYVQVHLLTSQEHHKDDLREFETFLASISFSEPQK